MATKQSGRLRSGYTLLEILIVVAVLVLLCALLFPVFSRARETGRRVSCLNNLREIGMGLNQYVQDNNRYMPLRYANNGTDSRLNTWRVALLPYVKRPDAFRCPTNPRHNQSATVVTGQQPDFKISYSCNYNDNGLGVFGNETGTKRVRITSITSPAETIAVTESSSSEPDLNTDNPLMIGQLFAGHLGNTNYLFVDNHVKALRPLRTYYDSTGAIRNMWYRDLTPFF